MEPIYGSVFIKPLSQTALTFLMPPAILEEAPYKELVPNFSLDRGQETQRQTFNHVGGEVDKDMRKSLTSYSQKYLTD